MRAFFFWLIDTHKLYSIKYEEHREENLTGHRNQYMKKVT